LEYGPLTCLKRLLVLAHDEFSVYEMDWTVLVDEESMIDWSTVSEI
jgi:hypothetical protein